ncbi:histidine kinase [Carboxylicivirga sp. A043]|uniref:sensor histidine kinase n=1 Tax=Carboxylicivirga litoralis TaxID=2816963 RepID=UPI0021CB7338|nr:histidine kinase [Carboxylicivirga sp. A043]MCU4156774.1 histidine kinase [Carboxylicivirga sp. A043]
MSIYKDINGHKHSKRTIFFTFLWFGLSSILIGVIFMGLACPSCLLRPKALFYNGGYSLLLGYSLFSFGFVFNWLESKYVDWIKFPVKSLLIVLLSSTVYCTIAIIGVNWFWHIIVRDIPSDRFWEYFGATMWIEFGIFYFIALWFYARSFFMAWRQEVEDREKLKRQALQLQYESLKTQVNPHFLFNSLNALTTLIEMDVASAKTFTNELSGFYRDILQLKNKEIIPLKEEINIVKRYIYLQKIRFGDSFSYQLPEDRESDQMVLPLSLQMLCENVFKHNVISSSKKLHLSIEILENEVLMTNTYYPKVNSSDSGMGLKNLNERIKYLTNKELTIIQSDKLFSIHLPLISL